MREEGAAARATVSRMEIGPGTPRNRTAEVIAAVESGERVPHGPRVRRLSGEALARELEGRAADPELADDLAELAGQKLDEL